MDDVFEVQDEVSQKVAALVVPSMITNEQKSLSKKEIQVFSGWDEFLHALNCYDNHSKAKTVEEKIKHIYKAIEHAEKSIALEPNFTEPYNVLAGSLFFLMFESSVQNDREKNEARYKEVSEKSISLDPNNPDALMNMAFLYRFLDDEMQYKELSLIHI